MSSASLLHRSGTKVAAASRLARTGGLHQLALGPALVQPSLLAPAQRSVSSSTRPTPSSSSPQDSRSFRRRSKEDGRTLVRSKGRLGLSAYLENLAQLGLSPPPPARPATPASSSSSSSASKSRRTTAEKKVKVRPPVVPVKERVFAAQQLELRDFLEDKRVEERDKRLARLGHSSPATKRNRWAWEWFEEGKELADIGERVAELPKYVRDEPYPAATVTEWILSHLRSTPSAASTTTPEADEEDADPRSAASAQRTHSLGLLTPESWARLSAPHPVWSTKPYEESLGAALADEDDAEQGVWDLLWARGWRGEGLGKDVVKAEAEDEPVESTEDRGERHEAAVPLPADVLARFLKGEEIRSAQQDLRASRNDNMDLVPESARIEMALERLRKKGASTEDVLRRLAGSKGIVRRSSPALKGGDQ